MAAAEPVVEASALAYSYRSARGDVEALRGLGLTVYSGEVLGVLGPTGSGKTTLIKVLAGTLTATGGHLRVAGHDLIRMGASERQLYRRQVVGCQWQDPSAALWPGLTALENVQVPMLARPGRVAARLERAAQLLEAMRLDEHALLEASSLPVAAQRRLALAVALANDPVLLLCDEPTADLDEVTARGLVDDLFEALAGQGTTAVIATHDPGLERRLDAAVRLVPLDV